MEKLIWCLGLPALLVAWMTAFGQETHEHGQYYDWFTSQRQEHIASKPMCCGYLEEKGGDAIYTDVIGDGNGGYLVKIAGKWEKYPFPVNPYLGNPTGQNVLWYKATDGGYVFYCLRLSTGA